MAAAAETTYGTPVNMEVGDDVFVDLGVEDRNGQQVISVCLDDGTGYVHVQLTADEAETLADVLRALARIGA